MSEIETYLEQLRSHLTDLDARRAEEIVAEARTHIESRAAQLRAGGMGDTEANAAAARTFGDPRLVAEELRQGNEHHRRRSALRALAALAVSLTAAFALGVLVPGIVGPQRDGRLVRAIQSAANLDLSGALHLLGAVAFVVGFAPAAFLSGIIAGRRHWWLAAVPGLLWACASVPLVVFYGTTRPWLAYALVIPIMASVAFAGLGWLGAHLPARGRYARAFVWICALHAVCLGVAGLHRAWYNLESFAIAAAVLQPVFLAALAAAHRDGRVHRQPFIALFAALAAAALLAAGIAALVLGSVGGVSAVGDDVYFWLAVTGVESVLALLGLLAWRLTRSRREGAVRVSEGPGTGGRA